MKKIIGYDFDGVVSLGITPSSSSDVIITGRCIDEKDYILNILKERGIENKVYFNPMTLEERGNHSISARTFSGKHKANTIKKLKDEGIEVFRFFEDDPIQLEYILESHPQIEIIHCVSSLVVK